MARSEQRAVEVRRHLADASDAVGRKVRHYMKNFHRDLTASSVFCASTT